MTLRNEPAELRRFVDALALAGVSVLALSWHPHGDAGLACLVASRPDGVEAALARRGWTPLCSRALSVPVPARATALARLNRMLQDAGVRLLGMYGATEGGKVCRLTLCVDRPERARLLLTPFAEAALRNGR